jgi:hypothetical protein
MHACTSLQHRESLQKDLVLVLCSVCKQMGASSIMAKQDTSSAYSTFIALSTGNFQQLIKKFQN